MANKQFRVSIGVDIDAARAKAGAGEARQAVDSVGESAAQATPKVQGLDAALGGLQDGAARAKAWQGILASEGMALDNLRAKYNPLFATIQQYKAAQTEIRTAHAMGALSSDEMTAALARQRQQALSTIAALKGIGAEAAALDALRLKYDPLYAASIKYQQALAEIEKAENAGALAADRAFAARRRAASVYDQDVAAVGARETNGGRQALAIVGSQTVVPNRAADIQAYAASLDQLRAKYNPLYSTIQQYKVAQAEIRQAHAVGALSADEMTAALARQRQQALATIAAIKGMPSRLPGGAIPAFQTANIAAQFQDVAVTAAMGMNPLQIALQQGTQLSSVLATSERPLQAILTGFTSLVSPVSLVTIGVVGLGAAAIQAFSSWQSGAETADKALEHHADLIKHIKAEYQTAGKGLAENLGPTSGVLSVYATENESVLRTKYAEASKEFARRFQDSSGIARVASSMNRNELSGAIDAYMASVRAGQPDIERFRESIASIYLDPRTSQGAKDQAVQLLKASESASELARSLPSAEKAISAADKAAERLANNLKLAQSGLSALGDFIPDQRTTTQRIEDAYAGAIGGAQSYMQVETITRRRAEALAEVQRQLDLTRRSDDLGTQAILARTAAERASIAAAQARVDALRQGGQSAAQIAEAERIARANVFAQEAASSRSTLEQAQRSAVGVGLSGLQATIAQINARYDLEIQKAEGAKEAIDNLRKARELEIATATRSAAIQPLQDAARSATELERAVALQRATFGLSAGQAANLTEQMRLYNEYTRAGIQMTPELARAIAEAGARYGAAAGEMDKVNKAQQDAISRMDGLRSATNSALGAAMEGDWESVGKAAMDWAKGLVTDNLTQGLLGRQGEAGGGLFGDLASNLLGGTARGASAANPLYVTFSGAGAGGLYGNLTAANTNSLGLVGGTDLMAKYREAIASIESSGRYGALGPITASGDRAYGRYGVMGANVGPWTQQALGYSMSPNAFLADPAAQDAVFNKIFGGLLSRFGNSNDAASAWFTGRPLALGANASDMLGTTGSSYVDKFNAALGTATTGLESFASSAKGASTGPAGGYPTAATLTPAQASLMPAGVSRYGTGWADQEVAGLSAEFSVLRNGVAGIADQFIPGLGSVLGSLLDAFSSGGGSSGGGFWSSLLSGIGSLFGGGGWGANNASAFSLYALGGVPAARGLHSYANQVVSTPKTFAFAKGAGVMGEAGEPEGIFPLTRDRSGRLGVRAQWDGPGRQDNGTSIEIHNYAGVRVDHETTRDSRGRRQERFVLSDAVGDAVATPGGGADRAMRQKYGMRSGGIRR